MYDMISRAAALDAIDGMKPMQGNMEQLVMKSLCYAAVKTIQPVDAAPVVHARWQGISPFVDSEECSNCRYCIYSEELETPYCPNCGAKMDMEAI